MGVENLYNAVKYGKIRPDQLNEEGKRAIKEYIGTRKRVDPNTTQELRNEQLSMRRLEPQRFEPSAIVEAKTDIAAKARELLPKKEKMKAPELPRIGNTKLAEAVDNFSKAVAEYSIPDAPLLKDGKPVPGTNAREEFLKQNNMKPSTGVASFVGQAIAPFMVPGAGLGTGKELYQGLAPAVEAIAPRLGTGLTQKVATEALREAAVGAPLMAGQELATGKSNFEDAAKSGAFGAALGAGTGTIAPVIGRAFQDTKLGQFFKDFAARKEQPKEPVLALPEPRKARIERMAMENIQPSGMDAINVPETGLRGLPEPRLAPPTTARIAKKVNPYEQKLTRLFEVANSQQLPPGREREALEDIWSRMAGPEDPGLDELIDSAYPPQKNRLEPGLIGKAKENQRFRQTVGAPNIVKSVDDRFDMQLGRAAMPETKAKFGPLKLPKKELPESILPSVEKMEARANDAVIGDAELLSDISGFSAQTRDFYRNMEAVLGKDRAKRFTEPFNAAKKSNIELQEQWVDRLKTEIVDNLGIQKGSKLSALVQQFGEKQISLDQLKAKAPDDWKKVVKADQWFRQAYDQLIDQVNATRAKIYPNSPDKIVPKRQDYYRHFQELNGLEGLKNLFDTPSQISPQLAGISEFVTPKSKFAGFMQRRGLGPFKNDAIGGFLNYLPSASYAIHIDPQISEFRTLRKKLAELTEDSKNINNFIEYLNDFSNDLAGKTNSADRFIQKVIPGGRKMMAAVQWFNNRTKANVILGNAGSTIAQLANIPNGVAFAKQYSIKGAGDTLLAPFVKNSVMEQSGFLKERYSGQLYRQFETKWFQQPQRFAEWMMETADRVGTYFVWNSAHAKGVSEGVANPIAYADDATRKLIAGRGIGEVPLLQKSKLVQIVAPFQLEVANLWRVMGDMVKRKDVAGLMFLFAANYAFNRGMERVKGSGVTFDPIQAIIEASESGLSPQQRVGRLAGEVLSNLPLGQTIASITPEYGGKLLGVDLPTRKELYGDNDPTRFGGGLVAVKGLQDPMFKMALPFGGNQLKKTLEGIETIRKGASYTDKGQLKFPVNVNPATTTQMLLFGPNSTAAAREYYGKDRRPLGDNDTEYYKNTDDKEGFYKSKMKDREINKLERKLTEIEKDDKMSMSKKEKEYNRILEKLRKAATGG